MDSHITEFTTEFTALPTFNADEICSIEFFHIYTDEKIDASHEASLRYLQAAKKHWNFRTQDIVLIDNYNPVDHTLSAEEVFEYLERHDALPSFWANEADMIENAQKLLEKITSKKVKKEYLQYIEKRGKYPCSLLTAAWYLTRLGYFDSSKVIQMLKEESYVPAAKLINILPENYQAVEGRCFELIRHSEYAEALDRIHDIFIPVPSHAKTSL